MMRLRFGVELRQRGRPGWRLLVWEIVIAAKLYVRTEGVFSGMDKGVSIDDYPAADVSCVRCCTDIDWD